MCWCMCVRAHTHECTRICVYVRVCVSVLVRTRACDRCVWLGPLFTSVLAKENHVLFFRDGISATRSMLNRLIVAEIGGHGV